MELEKKTLENSSGAKKSDKNTLWWLYDFGDDFANKEDKQKAFLTIFNERYDYLKNSCTELRNIGRENEKYYKSRKYYDFFDKFRDFIPQDYISNISRFGTPNTVLNICRSCVNTAQNKVAKITPIIELNTKVFSYARQDKILRIQDDIQNWMIKGGIHKPAKSTFFKANVCEVGYLKVHPSTKHKNFGFSCPNPMSILVEDPLDGIDYRSEIWECGFAYGYDIEDAFGIELKKSKKDEQILLMEAYKAGYYHVIATKDEIILLETWEHEPPYFQYIWSPGLKGFATFGIISEIKPIQQEINHLVSDIANSFRLMGRPRWLVSKEAKVTENDLINTISAIVYYQGKLPPEAYQPNPIHQAYFGWVRELVEYAHQTTGIPQIYSSGEIPKRMEARSGELLEIYDAIGSDRFQTPSQAYDDLFKRISSFMIEYAAKHWKKAEYGDLEVKDARSWTALLSSEHPAGQQRRARELLNANLITKDQYFETIQYNNLEKVISQERLGQLAIEKKLGDMLENGKYAPPDPHLGYDIQLQVASRMYKKLIYRGEEDKNKLQVMDTFLSQVKETIRAEARQNPPPPTPDQLQNENVPPNLTTPAA